MGRLSWLRGVVLGERRRVRVRGGGHERMEAETAGRGCELQLLEAARGEDQVTLCRLLEEPALLPS